MLLIGQNSNKHLKFTYNTVHILPVTMTCAVLCWQTYLGIYSSAFATFEPWRRHLKRVTSARDSQKSEYYMLAFDWLQQTYKIGCNIFPARMTCAELWCQIVWAREHFPQLCVKFQPWRGNWVICSWQHHISKMGYFKFKCTILFNICTISFLTYYDIGCIRTMFT